MIREFDLTDSDFTFIQGFIHAKAGISLGDHKRALVYTRLRKRLRHLGLPSFAEYIRYLGTTPDELQAFVNSLTTNHTSFFREAGHFDVLARFAEKRANESSFRVWCAASSSGEEPYSIAITLARLQRARSSSVSILASDIDTDVLAKAERAVYPVQAIENVAADIVRSAFLRGRGDKAGLCRVRDEIRALVTFYQVNLLDAHWDVEGPFDAIFCRNVFFYFDKAVQQRTLARLCESLRVDGLLFTGYAENFAHQSALLRPVGHSVYRRV